MDDQPRQISLGSTESFRWYFSRSGWSVLTVPLFLFLLSLFLISIYGTFIKSFAFFKVTWAVYGIVGIIAVLSLMWFIGLFLFGSPLIYYLLLTLPPAVWSNPSFSFARKLRDTIIGTVMALLLAWVLHAGTVWGIAWIADHNPCAAFEAGVTGSVPPTNC